MRFAAIFMLMMFLPPWASAQQVESATAQARVECPPDMVNIGQRFCIDRYEYPNKRGFMPVAGVTWLEAAALCRKQGKRLCSSDEWQRACAGSAERAYPYGDRFDREKCVSGRKHTRGASTSGTHPECVSPEGVYDMSGNLWEWTGRNAPEASLAGGGWMTGGGNSRCDSRAWTGLPGSTNFTYGFRCCLSPTPEQDSR